MQSSVSHRLPHGDKNFPIARTCRYFLPSSPEPERNLPTTRTLIIGLSTGFCTENKPPIQREHYVIIGFPPAPSSRKYHPHGTNVQSLAPPGSLTGKKPHAQRERAIIGLPPDSRTESKLPHGEKVRLSFFSLAFKPNSKLPYVANVRSSAFLLGRTPHQIQISCTPRTRSHW